MKSYKYRIIAKEATLKTLINKHSELVRKNGFMGDIHRIECKISSCSKELDELTEKANEYKTSSITSLRKTG